MGSRYLACASGHDCRCASRCRTSSAASMERPSPISLRSRRWKTIAWRRRSVRSIRSSPLKGSRTIDNTLVPYDEAVQQLDAANYFCRPHAAGASGCGLSRSRDGDDTKVSNAPTALVAESRGLPGAGESGRIQGRCGDPLLCPAAAARISFRGRGQRRCDPREAEEAAGPAHRRPVNVRPQHRGEHEDRRD